MAIDFVIPWVDGTDPAWEKERNFYLEKPDKKQASVQYRDWGLLRYWFRGVEQFAPWVRKIYFVTWRHVPEWLNCRHPKLEIVHHEDYMPREYLPTFSSHPIELNMHRIAGLAEQFVYFNDDTFLVKPVRETDFFYKNLPCDCPVLSALAPVRRDDLFLHILANNVALLNRHFVKPLCLRHHANQWLNWRYGKYLLKNLYYWPLPFFPGFNAFHLPAAFLKSTLEAVWREEYELLHTTSSHKFRTGDDINQYVFSYWQVASGKFWPRSPNIGRSLVMGQDFSQIEDAFRTKRYLMLCLNDSEAVIDFVREQKKIVALFTKLLPQKSSYEK